VPDQSQIDAEASGSDLEQRVAVLEDTIATLRRNLLEPAMTRPGLLRYGGNDMQLDGNGIQVLTASDLAALFFVPEFKLTPSTFYPKAQVSGFNTGTIASAYLSTYGASGQYAQVQTYTGITNAKPEVIIQTQTTGGVLAQIDMSATDAGSDAATMAFTGEIAPVVTAQTQITSDQNDYDVGARLRTAVSISSDAARNITGIDATNVLSGGLLLIQNTGGFAITLKDESASSTAANRFALSADIVLNPDDGCILQYNTTSSRWRAIAAPASGGVATDTIWDAKGDLAVGTGADTAQKLALGATGKFLRVNSAQTVGMEWVSHFMDVQTKTSGYTTLNTDQVILCDASGGAWTLSLISAASGPAAGMSLIAKKTDTSTNAVTIDANGTETIDGALTYVLSAQYSFVHLVSDGTNWHVVSEG